MAVAFAATEAILIVTLRVRLPMPRKSKTLQLTGEQIPYYKGVEWPMMMMAILASVMQCLGLIMPYFEMAKRQGRVIGIGMFSIHS